MAQLPLAPIHPDLQAPLTPRQAALVDDRQDVLMAAESPDGTPPSSQVRSFEWKWVAIVVPIIAIAALSWAIVGGAGLGLILAVISALILAFLLGGWPVWGAAILRGQEQHAARSEATAIQLNADNPHNPQR